MECRHRIVEHGRGGAEKGAASTFIAGEMAALVAAFLEQDTVEVGFRASLLVDLGLRARCPELAEHAKAIFFLVINGVDDSEDLTGVVKRLVSSSLLTVIR